MEIETQITKVLSDQNYRIIQLPHPWLKIFVQNFDSHAALLIEADIPEDLFVSDGRGFDVKTERIAAENYVRITSSQPGISAIFVKFIEYILEKTADVSSPEQSISILPSIISEFRRFFGRRSGRLTHEEVQGLFAELFLIINFLEREHQPFEVITSWKGPKYQEGLGLHDFSFADGRSIEVKSAQYPAKEIRVSSPDQLSPSEETLNLVVLPIESVGPTHGTGTTIRQLIQVCKNMLAEQVESLDLFMQGIDALGTDFSDEYYDQWKFVPGQWQAFEVSEGFPAIDAGQIPKGILKVTYSLALKDLADFETSFTDLLILGTGGTNV